MANIKVKVGLFPIDSIVLPQEWKRQENSPRDWLISDWKKVIGKLMKIVTSNSSLESRLRQPILYESDEINLGFIYCCHMARDWTHTNNLDVVKIEIIGW